MSSAICFNLDKSKILSSGNGWLSLKILISDFCLPNPCENGGTCVPSIWPSEPQLTTCQCLPGFDGHYCQYKALDVCELPVSRGMVFLNIALL